MRIGVTFPQTELGGDVGALRAYGQAAEDLGYTHLLAYARGQAGGGGRPPHSRPLPARCRFGMEPGRVRGSRPAFRSARPSPLRADRSASAIVDRDLHHPLGHRRHGHRRRYLTAAHPTPHVVWAPAEPDRFASQVEQWRDVGATHLSIDTMSTGLHTVDDHIAGLQHAASLIGVRPGLTNQQR